MFKFNINQKVIIIKPDHNQSMIGVVKKRQYVENKDSNIEITYLIQVGKYSYYDYLEHDLGNELPAEDVDAEQAINRLYKKLMADKVINETDVIFADVTVKELASTLEAACGCIDILKFEMGDV